MLQKPDFRQDVIDFHKTMDLPLIGLSQADYINRCDVFRRLIREEYFTELPMAEDHYEDTGSGLEEVLDAICDSIYVLLGFAICVETASIFYLEESVLGFPDDTRTIEELALSLERLAIKLIGENKFYACWNEVHRTNMAKADGPVVDGKKLKPPGWKPPHLKEIIEGGTHE